METMKPGTSVLKNVYVNVRKKKIVNKTVFLQIQSGVYWSTLTYSSENGIPGCSQNGLIPEEFYLHGL